jgi:hypothetical protein
MLESLEIEQMFDILLFLLYILGKEEMWMAKYSAEELSSRINELELDDDVKISLMEDITDSVTPDESEELATLKGEVEKAHADYEELKEKYKARFLKAVDTEEEKEVKDEELEEKEVIDVKEL